MAVSAARALALGLTILMLTYCSPTLGFKNVGCLLKSHHCRSYSGRHPTIQNRRYAGDRLSLLRMHLGHDHSHSHHHDDTHCDDRAPSLPLLSSWGRGLHFLGLLLQPRPQAQRNLLISSLIMLVPVLVRRRFTRLDAGIFVLAASALTLFDSAKRASRTLLRKVNGIRATLAKHSTPITKEYFFKNDNAADRVTLLGVVVNVGLSITKFAGGLAFNSAVLVADAGHSLSDLLSDFICLWAVQVCRALVKPMLILACR